MIKNLDVVIKLLKKEYKKFKIPIVTEFSVRRDPYLVLISCLISLRTKDEVTRDASYRLFKLADNAKKMSKLSLKQIEKAIYPAGFYITKAKRIKEISKLVEKGVPDDIDELLKLKGVGRKTANLVMTLGFGKYGICVDVHVHRISNRLGWVKTKTPEQTEFKLREILPKKYWIVINDLLVAYGQNLCVPVSPFCSKCVVRKYCKRVGVGKSR